MSQPKLDPISQNPINGSAPYQVGSLSTLTQASTGQSQAKLQALGISEAELAVPTFITHQILEDNSENAHNKIGRRIIGAKPQPGPKKIIHGMLTEFELDKI